jgi:hypothetical protein
VLMDFVGPCISVRAWVGWECGGLYQIYTGDEAGPSSGFSIPAAMKLFCALQTRAEMSLCAIIISFPPLYRHMLGSSQHTTFNFKNFLAAPLIPESD